MQNYRQLDLHLTINERSHFKTLRPQRNQYVVIPARAELIQAEIDVINSIMLEQTTNQEDRELLEESIQETQSFISKFNK